MPMLDVLESYVTASNWKPAKREDAEVRLCTRCGKRESSVAICVPCLLEVAARLAVNKQEKQRLGILQWAVVVLVSFGVLAVGSLLSSILH